MRRRAVTPIRTRAPATGLCASSITWPLTTAPAESWIVMPVFSVLPSSVTCGELPGAYSGCAAANRNVPAAIASIANVPSAPVAIAS